MRVVLIAFCVVSVLVSVGYANPLKRDKRLAPFAGTYAGTFPFPGAYAGVGMNPFQFPAFPGFPSFWDFPKPRYIPFPIIPFSFPVEWYQGENVCKEVKTVNAKTPDEFSDWMRDVDSPNVDAQFNHESESCKGTNSKYVCMKRIYDSTGEEKLQATKYECCHGFVRNPEGPGCIENQTNAGAQQSTQQNVGREKTLNSNDKTYYGFVPSSSTSQSSSVSSSSGSLDKVPIQ
ncbi:uncharacterized protein TNCT_97111 [Trichonephila clavata]|uniref:Uncharacterized protein n=1 Tax=Trichonephila clavata TaxID=2740835 RepID=A0A8X6HGR6_TRICU|nr:uncharacterized protein TNCT_97111 [Trichonephila clavata]